MSFMNINQPSGRKNQASFKSLHSTHGAVDFSLDWLFRPRTPRVARRDRAADPGFALQQTAKSCSDSGMDGV